jgi:hypothetical protein
VIVLALGEVPVITLVAVHAAVVELVVVGHSFPRTVIESVYGGAPVAVALVAHGAQRAVVPVIAERPHVHLAVLIELPHVPHGMHTAKSITIMVRNSTTISMNT